MLLKTFPIPPEIPFVKPLPMLEEIFFYIFPSPFLRRLSIIVWGLIYWNILLKADALNRPIIFLSTSCSFCPNCFSNLFSAYFKSWFFKGARSWSYKGMAGFYLSIFWVIFSFSYSNFPIIWDFFTDRLFIAYCFIEYTCFNKLLNPEN